MQSNKDDCCAEVRDAIPPDFFKALGDPNRVALLARLAESCNACCVGDLAGCCDVDLSVVSRHLAALKAAGILEAEKRGRNVFYRVRVAHVVQTLRAVADAIEQACGPAARPDGGGFTAPGTPGGTAEGETP